MAPMVEGGTEPRSEWSFLGEDVLHVSRHVPARDGIARYADQLEAALGPERFTRLGVPGGGGRVVSLWGWLRPLRLLWHARGHDEVLVEYHPSYFLMGPWASRLASYAALAVVARATRASWIVHEPDDPMPDEIGRRGRIQYRIEERVRRLFWSGARRLVFHTRWEREAFDGRFPGRGRDERLVTHGGFFTVAAPEVPRGEARRRLGLPAAGTLLLCIGFLSPHKRVDEVIRAIDDAGVDGVQLRIVGEPICDYPHVLRHVEKLRAQAAAMESVELHEEFVSDEDFDLWIRAADAVIAGYGSAASSSVVARTQMLGTRLVTSAAGGLAEQARNGDLRFASREELVQIVRGLG
jgi:glycosyltransferase involved in cell wall biosynthesis